MTKEGIYFYIGPKGYGKTYEALLNRDKYLTKEVEKYIRLYEKTKQENQQLKEKLKLVESLASFNMPDNMPMVCMFKADYERNKYEYETLDKYKSVLDEIREDIKPLKTCEYNFSVEEPNIINPHYEICDEVKEHLLQILDKVKE